MRTKSLRLGAGVLAVLLGAAPALAAPVTFNTALPISKGEAIVRLVAGYDEASFGGTTLTERSIVGVGVYGLTPRLAIFGIVPFSRKRLETPVGARSSTGVGDGRFFVRYTIFQEDGPGRTFRVAPFLGIVAPTGDDNASDAVGRLPQPLQPGSGSWGSFGGAVATYATTRMNFDIQVSYRRNNEANGFEAGDAARVDISLQRRISDAVFGGSNPIFAYVGLEGAAMTIDESRFFGATNPNTGGQLVVGGPTLQLAARRWIADVALQVPLTQSMNGSGLEKGISVRAGLRASF